MENKEFKIAFGAMSLTIVQQLKEQKFKYDAEEVKHIEKLRHCLLTLFISGIINDKTYDKARQKLFNRLQRHVMKKNGFTKTKMKTT